MSDVKKSKMLLGFNHNIKHKSKIYHVQTEDSGIDNPHIITHLFVGGNILATKKTSYADIVKAENFIEVVRELMEEQHKAMLRNLVNGVYDNLETVPAEQSLTASQFVFSIGATKETAVPSQGPQAKSSVPSAGHSSRTKPIPSVIPSSASRTQRPSSVHLSKEKSDKSVPLPVRSAQKPSFSPESSPKATSPSLPSKERLQISEAPTQVAMPAFRSAKKKTDLGTKVFTSLPSEVVPEKQEPHRVTLKPKQSVSSESPASGGLPPEVLAARRMVERPTPKDTSGPTIFGEDLISEKSLDEVILGYLAGEGENGS